MKFIGIFFSLDIIRPHIQHLVFVLCDNRAKTSLNCGKDELMHSTEIRPPMRKSIESLSSNHGVCKAKVASCPTCLFITNICLFRKEESKTNKT